MWCEFGEPCVISGSRYLHDAMESTHRKRRRVRGKRPSPLRRGSDGESRIRDILYVSSRNRIDHVLNLKSPAIAGAELKAVAVLDQFPEFWIKLLHHPADVRAEFQ